MTLYDNHVMLHKSHVTLSISVPFCFLERTCSSIAFCSGKSITRTINYTGGGGGGGTDQVGISPTPFFSLDDLVMDKVSITCKRVLYLTLYMSRRGTVSRLASCVVW